MDNENFNVEFGEVVNIGGGTSDFNQLSNRPKYNNATMTGDTNIPKVPTKTSELNNDSDYQTGTEVESAISTMIAGKQDTLTAGNNITISNNTISATDTTYSAGTGLTLDGTQFSVNTETIATQQDVSNEATARENADTNLQGQIDAISASSDVTDIVGTYAALQAYDTTHLKDNDIIKVLQDESQNDETTYYRWSTSTQTFTLIGEEGPYYTKSQTDTLLQAKQDTLTAGTNIQINNNTISATDTTYSDFTGTDGTAAGTAGLVPAPATTDAGKFLKADGTWDTAGGGSGPTVVQTTGTSTTDVMSQNAVTSMIFADPAKGYKIRIGSTGNISNYAIRIGYGGQASNTSAVSIGQSAQVTSQNSVALGSDAFAKYRGSVALGSSAQTTVKGQIMVGTTNTYDGYNSTNYRIISGVHDAQSDNDAVNLGQLNGRVLQNAGAPTTSTVGTVGQLLEDTTNGKLYICTDATNPYVWEEVGAGGGSGPTVVQTTGTSATDVMSQNATTSMVFKDPSTQEIVKIGNSAIAGTNRNVAIGYYATANNTFSVAVGGQSYAPNDRATALGSQSNAQSNYSLALGNGATVYSGATYSAAIGYNSKANQNFEHSVALGDYASTTRTGEINIGAGTSGHGYNSTNYRVLGGVHDGQLAHDAATVAQGNTLATSAPTTSTVGVLGQLYTDTTNMHTYQCTAISGGTYTWTQRW